MMFFGTASSELLRTRSSLLSWEQAAGSATQVTHGTCPPVSKERGRVTEAGRRSRR
jgi:hypothetical protein